MIYFLLLGDGSIKIGHTTRTLAKRLREHERNHQVPKPIRVLGCCIGDRVVERHLHFKFDRERRGHRGGPNAGLRETFEPSRRLHREIVRLTG